MKLPTMSDRRREAIHDTDPTLAAQDERPGSTARAEDDRQQGHQRQPTGIRLLDHLLDGGLPARSFSLVHGPSFTGDDVLARQVALANLAEGIPAILVLTRSTATDVRERLRAMEPRVREHEEAGRIRYVDTYSRSIGAEEPDDHVRYTDTPADLEGVATALHETQDDLASVHPNRLVVLDSVSTMALYHDIPTVFRFIQVLSGKARRAGSTLMTLLDDGMHDGATVHGMRHLSDGAFTLRRENETAQVRIEGFGVAKDPGWLDYSFTETSFEVTGTLAGGRIL